MKRDFVAEAQALPHHDFDLLMHGYLWKTFEPWMKSLGPSALELGCFHGEMTARIYEEFPDTCVVEASEECIRFAKNAHQASLRMVEFIHSTFEDVKLDRQFDAIFLIHALEHVDDPVALLKRCREWLYPGGKLFLAVPNAYAASRQLAVKMGLVESPEAVMPAEREHGHRRTYSMALLFDHVTQGDGRYKIHAAGGVMFKPLANFQMDRALAAGIIDRKYLDACYELGKEHPEMCASIYMVCGR